MSRDQAEELRQLALKSAAGREDRTGAAAPLVVVAGGKGGVGTTTVAVNLAAALAIDGRRMLLVDADLTGDATAMCGLDVPFSLRDVLSGRRDLHEILFPGPAGMQVLPGAWPAGPVADCSAESQARLISRLRDMESHIDAVVIDAGNGLQHTVGRFWQAADLVLLVTSPDDVSVMNSYAAVKGLMPPDCPCPVSTVVNRTTEPDIAVDVHDRLARACQRFLGRRLSPAGRIVEDALCDEAVAAGVPLVVCRRQAPAAGDFVQLSRFVGARLQSSLRRSRHEGSVTAGRLMVAG